MRWVSSLMFVALSGFGGLLLVVGCGEKAKRWGDALEGFHDEVQDGLVKLIGESKVLRAELDRRIDELQSLEKELTRLEAQARVRRDLLPRQFRDAERELQSTQRSRERLRGLLAESGGTLTIGGKQYSRSAAEQMKVQLEVEEEDNQERLEALRRNQQRIERGQPVLIARRDKVRTTIIRVKAARNRLDREISEKAMARRIEEAVGGGESSVEEAERRIETTLEELTVEVRGDIVVADDVIGEAAKSQEMHDLRAALGG